MARISSGIIAGDMSLNGRTTSSFGESIRPDLTQCPSSDGAQLSVQWVMALPLTQHSKIITPEMHIDFVCQVMHEPRCASDADKTALRTEAPW
jgi:hypothetical protein